MGPQNGDISMDMFDPYIPVANMTKQPPGFNPGEICPPMLKDDPADAQVICLLDGEK